jgi:hypothetical protein
MQSKREGASPFVGPWHRWFAWYRVSLLGASRTAWLGWVFRRKRRYASGPEICEYTDAPELHPIGPLGSDHWL